MDGSTSCLTSARLIEQQKRELNDKKPGTCKFGVSGFCALPSGRSLRRCQRTAAPPPSKREAREEWRITIGFRAAASAPSFVKRVASRSDDGCFLRRSATLRSPYRPSFGAELKTAPRRHRSVRGLSLFFYLDGGGSISCSCWVRRCNGILLLTVRLISNTSKKASQTSGSCEISLSSWPTI